MSFLNLNNQLKKCCEMGEIPLEEALCLMDMVGKDLKSDAKPITKLQVENWTRLRNFLLSLSGTINIIYQNYGEELARNAGAITSKHMAALPGVEEELRRLTEAEAAVQEEIRRLEKLKRDRDLRKETARKLQAEKERLARELQQVEEVDLSTLEQEKNALTTRLTEASARRDALHTDNQTAEKDLEQIRKQLEKDSAEAESLREKRQEAEKSLDAVKNTCAALHGQIEQAGKKQAQYAAEEENLNQQMASMSAQLNELNAKVVTLRDNHTKQQQTLEGLRNVTTGYETEIKKLDAQITAAQQNEQEQQRTYNAREKTLGDLQKQKLELETELKNLETQIRNAEQENGRISTEKETAVARTAELQQQTQTLTQENQQLQDRYAEAEGARDQAETARNQQKQALTELLKVIDCLDNQRSELDKQLTDETAKRESLLGDTLRLTEELEQEKQTYETLSVTFLKLERDLSAQKKNNEDYRQDHLLPKQQEVADAQELLETMTGSVKELEKELEELEKQSGDLRKNINSANTLIAGETVTIEELNQDFRQKQQELSQKCAEAETLRQTHQQELDALNKKLNNLTNGVIGPLVEEIRKLRQILEDKGSQDALDAYRVKKEELKKKVEETQRIENELPLLQAELDAAAAECSATQRQLEARQTSIREIKSQHDRLKEQLEELNDAATVREVEACRQRLETMEAIRKRLVEVSRKLGCGMEYQDMILSDCIQTIRTTLDEIQQEITEYSELWTKKIDP